MVCAFLLVLKSTLYSGYFSVKPETISSIKVFPKLPSQNDISISVALLGFSLLLQPANAAQASPAARAAATNLTDFFII